MLRWIHRITPMALCLLMAFGAHAQSQTGDPQPASTQTEAEKALSGSQFVQTSRASLTRRIEISERANAVFTLLASELAWGQGQTGTALATHELVLQKSQDPAVAERAMEMALAINATQKARTILQQWQNAQPEDTPARQRLSWQLALAEKDIPFVASHIDTVLNQASEYQLRRLFLLLAQSSLSQKNWPDSVYTAIHKAAQKHQDMPEAMIAEAIYSALGEYDRRAVAALQKLASLDGNMQPGSQITISLVGQLRPQVLTTFFQPESFNALPAVWQSIYIDWLITHKKTAAAYQALQPVLNHTQSPALYLQAVFLAINQRAQTSTILDYAQQAYALGDDTQKVKQP